VKEDIERKKKHLGRRKILLIALVLLLAGGIFFFFSQKKKESLLRTQAPLPPGPSILQMEPPLPNLVNTPIITAQPPAYEPPYKEEVIAYLRALEKILQDWAETERTDIAQQQLQALIESLFSLEEEQNFQDTLKAMLLHKPKAECPTGIAFSFSSSPLLGASLPL